MAYVILLELYELKKCIKNDTLYIKNDYLLIILLLNDEPSVSKRLTLC